MAQLKLNVMKKVLFFIPLLVISFAFAQRKKETAAPPQSAESGIQSKVLGMQSFPGFFEFSTTQSRTGYFW